MRGMSIQGARDQIRKQQKKIDKLRVERTRLLIKLNGRNRVLGSIRRSATLVLSCSRSQAVNDSMREMIKKINRLELNDEVEQLRADGEGSCEAGRGDTCGTES